MLFRWRWSLVVVLAAVVLSGFLPQALLSGIRPPAGIAVLSAPNVPSGPVACAGADCGKSAPAAVTPGLSGAMLVALGGAAVIAVAAFASRRIRSRVQCLPRGSAIRLFHPPQFSGFDPSVV
jgi:hypothetical protein